MNATESIECYKTGPLSLTLGGGFIQFTGVPVTEFVFA